MRCHLAAQRWGGTLAPAPKALACAADQLQRTVERGEYAEAARLLEAVQQLAAHFAAFGAVPKARGPDNAGHWCGWRVLQPQADCSRELGRKGPGKSEG